MAAAQEPNVGELAALQDQHAPVVGAEPAVAAAEPAGVAAEPAVNNRNEVLLGCLVYLAFSFVSRR